MIGATLSVVRLVRCAPLGAMALLLGCSVLMAPATPPAQAAPDLELPDLRSLADLLAG